MTNPGGRGHAPLWTAVALALVTACAAAPSREPAASDDAGGPALPAGAIPAGDNLYMVPMGADETGCTQYRMHAPGRATVQAIYYADGKGGFTMNREAAECQPPRPAGSGR